MLRRFSSLLVVVQIMLFSVSCISTRKTVYFHDVGDTTFSRQAPENEPLIKTNDILSISISSLNPEASAIFNTANDFVTRTTTATGGITESSGYLVNPDGFIQLPLLGDIKAAGLTKNQLKDQITDAILTKKLLIDPIVIVRYLNFEVTVIGEVAHPTVITVPSEQISLIKAIGLAGDLTIYGKRDNILLIREENGKRITRHIDLNSSDFLNSPYYYLQPNDVVYVSPNKAKVASASGSRQWLPVILTSLSLFIIVLDRLVL